MRFKFAAVAAPLFVFVGAAHATDVTDLVGGQGWFGGYDNGGTYSNGIESFSNDGDGSLFLTTNGSSGRSRVGLFATGGSFGTLDALVNGGNLQFDFFRDLGLTSTSNIQLAFKLYVRNASGQSASLIWEDAYNGTAATTGTWNNDRVISNENWWIRSGGINYQEAVNAQSLATWLAGGSVTNGNTSSIALGSGTLITGIEIGAGGGWEGTFSGNADDVRLAFNNGFSGSWNFKSAGEPVPEPMTMALMGLGAAAMVRRKLAKK